MSHSIVYVLLREIPLSETILEDQLDAALAPFNENLEVPVFKEDCYCRGAEVRNKIERQALLELFKVEDFQQLRQQYEASSDYKLLANSRSLLITVGGGRYDALSKEAQQHVDTLMAAMDKLWTDKIIAPFKAKLQEVTALTPKAELEKPTADCPSCHGTGSYDSTRNPKSKWDWWVIGGRWSGAIQGRKDVKEREDAYVKRTGFDNTRLVSELIDAANSNSKDVAWCPFAVLTPDGEWHERGEMGWFGMAKDKKDKDTWQDQVHKIYEQHRDCLAVCVDVHI